MTEPAPRWQFKLADLFVACSLIAAFLAVFTALPLKSGRDDYRGWPAVIFTTWIGCVIRQLRKGRLLSRPRTVGLLLLGPFLGIAITHWTFRHVPRDFLSLVGMIHGVCRFTAGSIVLSWMYGRSSRP